MTYQVTGRNGDLPKSVPEEPAEAPVPEMPHQITGRNGDLPKPVPNKSAK